MALDKDDIIEFQVLYEAHFGVRLSEQEALEKGLRLLRLIEAVARALANDSEEKASSSYNE